MKSMPLDRLLLLLSGEPFQDEWCISLSMTVYLTITIFPLT